MQEAMIECKFDDHIKKILRAFFDSAATFMINKDG